MKRLIVCCDGTWNKPDNETITNIEKIARTVQSDPAATGGTYQLVYYTSGVGAGGYKLDKLLGGAFGFGLLRNVIACYRFLAQNYEPGDQIFIFGFSRGAYTARSVAGWVARVGLLTKESLVNDKLPAAVALYRRETMSGGDLGESVAEFRRDHCHRAKVAFLGVFDTVGALGVPGLSVKAPKFHDVQLSSQVLCARQALAIDETRLKFAPALWEVPRPDPQHPVVPPAPTQDGRVKQVWFEGCHSDIGGGYRQTGLSDTVLHWMATEAHTSGLVFDTHLLGHYLHSGEDPIRHNPLNRMYRVDNLLLTAKTALGGGTPEAFVDGRRRLTNDRAVSVRVASSAVTHFLEGGYKPVNLQQLAESGNGFEHLTEPVVALPQDGLDIDRLGAPASAPVPTPDH